MNKQRIKIRFSNGCKYAKKVSGFRFQVSNLKLETVKPEILKPEILKPEILKPEIKSVQRLTLRITDFYQSFVFFITEIALKKIDWIHVLVAE